MSAMWADLVDAGRVITSGRARHERWAGLSSEDHR